ncbi:MAG: DegT/DnrJ/EryC1/StrS family aminotransferase [Candidatus Glassbacteria bacterium]|nr:DegT/DnrJ/EryC1/StrS family aminotransferase [Candidatus Glassbacteria bacterium]
MPKTALLGGKPVSAAGYELKWPVVDEEDVEAAKRVAESGAWWRFDGKEVENFEKEFGRCQDARYVLGVANGTVALEVALRACGIEAGDEVIVPAITFIASASAVLLVQGIPVFADILEDTCQIDPADIERKITERTRAIVVVHYGGYPADMDDILSIARAHGLKVIEDAAHAHGSEWRGTGAGSLGDMGTFSFQQSKTLTCGEGGAVATNSEDLYNKAFAYHHIGRVIGSDKYEHTSVGPNYRMNEFQGAILRTQLGKLLQQTETRMKNAAILARGLEDLPGLQSLKKDLRITRRGYYLYVLLFDEEAFGIGRERFMQAMKAEGAELLPGNSVPVYRLPAFREMSFGRKGCPLTCGHYQGKMDYSRVSCPVAEKVGGRRLMVLLNEVLLKEGNIRLFLEAAHKVYENRAELLEKT